MIGWRQRYVLHQLRPYMKFFARLSFYLFRIFQSCLSPLVKVRIIGPDIDQFNIDHKQPVIFANLFASAAERLMIDREAKKLNWPSPIEQLDNYSDLKYPFFSVYRHSSIPFRRQPQPIVDKRLIHLAQWLKQNPDKDIQIIPARVFWGRAPEKERSFLRIWLQNSGTIGGRLLTAFAIIFNGRNTFIHFSRPISLREMLEDVSSSDLLARKVARVLRVHNRHVSASVLGPDLSHRRTLVHQIPNRPLVRKAIEEEARKSKRATAKVKKAARAYADEIASNISYSNIRFLDVLLTWVWNKIYAGIELHNITPLKDISKDNTVIYVPCHRSHIDYLLLSYVLYHQGLQLPHIAAGINLNMPIVGGILRRGGAFFMRRTFRNNKLYTAVFDEYLHSVFTRGYASEYFVEGGRSRTGRTLSPKAGMLAMTLRSFLRDNRKPILFMPVYTGYERVFEANSYLGELRGNTKRKESLFGVLGTLRSMKNSFGRVHVTFGEPIYLSEFLDEQQPQWQEEDHTASNFRPKWAAPVVQQLANKVAISINSAASLNPVNLLALAILSSPRQAMDQRQLLKHMEQYHQLIENNPYSHLTRTPAADPEQWLQHVESLDAVSRNQHPLGDMIQTDERQAVTLTYYRNNVLHLFALPALVATVFLGHRNCQRQQVISSIRTLYPFVKAELFLRWSLDDLDEPINTWIDQLLKLGYLVEQSDKICVNSANIDKYSFLSSLASHMLQAIERYSIAVRLTMNSASQSYNTKQLIDQCVLQAQRVSLLGGINAPEFFDKSLFSNLIQVMVDQDMLSKDEELRLITKPSLLTFNDLLDQLIPGQLTQLIKIPDEVDV